MGNILRFGVCAESSFSQQALSGERIMRVDNLEDKMDQTYKIGNPTGETPTIGKKAKTEEEI